MQQVVREPEREHVERDADDERVRVQPVAEVAVDRTRRAGRSPCPTRSRAPALCITDEPIAPAYAPDSIIASTEMLSVPARSATYSPHAANDSGTLRRTALVEDRRRCRSSCARLRSRRISAGRAAAGRDRSCTERGREHDAEHDERLHDAARDRSACRPSRGSSPPASSAPKSNAVAIAAPASLRATSATSRPVQPTLFEIVGREPVRRAGEHHAAREPGERARDHDRGAAEERRADAGPRCAATGLRPSMRSRKPHRLRDRSIPTTTASADREQRTPVPTLSVRVLPKRGQPHVRARSDPTPAALAPRARAPG